MMERIRAALGLRSAYEPLDDGSGDEWTRRRNHGRFSLFNYGTFLLVGMSMLWAW